MVTAHPVVVLEMADHGLDGGATSHLAADDLGNPAGLAADPDLEPIGIVVAAIPLVAVDAAHRNTCEYFKIGDDGTKRVAVIGVAVQRLGVQHELPALGRGDRGDDRDLAAELVGRPRLAFADALHLGGVQRVDLGAALALLLMADPQRQIEQRAKPVLERGIALDLAPDVANDAAKTGSQEFELSPGALELMRMGITPDHDGGALGQAQIALAQLDALALGQIDQLLDRAVDEPRVRWMGDRFLLHGIAQGGTGQMLSLPMNEFLQQSFKEIGIDIDFKVGELETLYTHWRKGAADEMNDGIIANNIAYVPSDPLYAIVRFFASDQIAPVGVNWGGYKNPKVDALINEAKQTFDPTKQDALIAQAHGLIVDDAVLVWVVHDTNPHALSPKVKQFVQAQHWFQDLTTIGLE